MTFEAAHKGVCAVSGASGFVGMYLLRALTARGWQVVPMNRRAVDFSDSKMLSGFLNNHGVTHVVHLAAESNPTRNDVRSFYEINAFLTERLFEAAVEADLCRRVVYVSATSVYGDSGAAPQHEDSPRRPLNHYGASKLLAEVFASWYRDRLDVTIARPSNCIGVGQNPRYLVPKLVAAFAARDPEIAMGDVEIARDFVDIRDAADILVRTLAAPAGVAPEVNVSSGRATPIREILDDLARLSGHSPDIKRDERFVRAGDMRYQACDNSLAKNLGHTPQYRLVDTLSWMLSATRTS